MKAKNLGREAHEEKNEEMICKDVSLRIRGPAPSAKGD